MTDRELSAQLKELVAANTSANAQLLNRFAALLRSVADARPATGTNLQDPQALVSRWLDFNLASYSAISTHSLALMNGLLSAAENALNPPPSVTDPPGTQEVELRVQGHAGERVTAGFVVENQFDRPLAVSVECDELMPRTGAPVPASLVTFEPASMTIAPHGQGMVQVAIAVTKAFEVGQTYSSTIRLLGFQDKEVRLSLTVLPPADKVAPAKRSVRKPPVKRRKRPVG